MKIRGARALRERRLPPDNSSQVPRHLSSLITERPSFRSGAAFEPDRRRRTWIASISCSRHEV